MVALVGTLLALLGIAAFCGAGIVHYRWENALRTAIRRIHRCSKCGYSLDGMEAEICPECATDRTAVEPLTERQRAAIALWMVPAVLACLFGLMTSDPRDITGPMLLASAWVWLNAIACRQVSMVPYFGILAVGLAILALMALGEKVGETDWTMLMWLAMFPMLLGPLGLVVVQLRRGRLRPDAPVKRG